MSVPVVTDHAVLRYLERAHGLDVEHFRAHIRELVTLGAAAGATGVIVEGVKFVLEGDTVVTVLERNMRLRPPCSGPEAS